MKKIILLAFAFLLTAACQSWADMTPRVDYSADSVIETDDSVINEKVYYTPGKKRSEMDEQGMQLVTITRMDKKVVWTLLPEKMYKETKLEDDKKSIVAGYKVEQSVVGEETVNGIKATKSKIVMTGRKGDKLGGFWWTTKDGIIVKLDAISVEKKSKERIKMELKNLKIAKQDASLFEIPKGYEPMSAMGFGKGMGLKGMKDMMKGFGGDDEEDGEE